MSAAAHVFYIEKHVSLTSILLLNCVSIIETIMGAGIPFELKYSSVTSQ